MNSHKKIPPAAAVKAADDQEYQDPPLPEIDWSAKSVDFSDEQLEGLFGDGCVSEPINGAKVVSDNIVDHRRWAVVHEIIVTVPGAPEGYALQGRYTVGATEYQDGDGLRNEFVVVRAVPVVRIEHMRPKLAERVMQAQGDAFMRGGDLADMARAVVAVENGRENGGSNE